MSKLISLKQFINKYNGKSVDVPWGYKGECVSLIQRYLNECYGVEMKARGNAKDWQNSILREGLGVTTNYPVRGDIVIWGAEAGNGMGHIAIYLDKTHDFDQNKGGDRITGIKTRRGGKIQAYMHITPLIRPSDQEDKPVTPPSNDSKFNIGDEVYVDGKLFTNTSAVKTGNVNHKGTKTKVDIVSKNGVATIHVKGNGADGWAKPSQVRLVNDKPKPKQPVKEKNRHGQYVSVGQRIQFSGLYTQDSNGVYKGANDLYFKEKRGPATVGYGYVTEITKNGYKVSKENNGSTIGFVRYVNVY